MATDATVRACPLVSAQTLGRVTQLVARHSALDTVRSTPLRRKGDCPLTFRTVAFYAADMDERRGPAAEDEDQHAHRLPDPSLARAALAVAATMLIGALAAVLVTTAIDRGRWEQAVIGLTSESEWPMHDVHLATAAGQLDDPDLVAGVLSSRGLGDDVVVSLDRERQSGNGTLTISARASSPDTAAEVANAVAEQVVASVPDDTPIRLVDRANASPTASLTAIAGSGGFVGLLIGLVVWCPPASRIGAARRPTLP